MNDMSGIAHRSGLLPWTVWLLLLPVLCAGCTKTPQVAKEKPDPTRKLTGKIELDGQPVQIGIVRAYSENGEHAEGRIFGSGLYIISDPPLGTVRLAYVPSPLTHLRPEQPPGPKFAEGSKIAEKFKERKKAIQTEAKLPESKLNQESQKKLDFAARIPVRYRDPNGSGFEINIVEGDNAFHMKMTSKE